MKNWWRQERGQSMVLAALSMVVVLGFTALAVDGGFLYFRHTRLQDTADAAALAAAIEVIGTTGNDNKKKQAGATEAISNMESNGFTALSTTGYTADIALGDESGTMTVSYPEGLSKVQVDVTLNTDLFFARVLGHTNTPVTASAIVQIGQASEQTGNLLPVAFFWGDYQWWTRYEMTLTPGEGVSGNFGFLDYDDPNMFDDYLLNGFGGTVEIGDVVATYTGASVGIVDHTIQERISRCTDGCSITANADGTTTFNYKEDCPRVVIIPIVTGFFEQNGKSYVTVSGFASFFIEDYYTTGDDKKTLVGWFLQEVSPSALNGTSNFTTQAVRLIK